MDSIAIRSSSDFCIAVKGINALNAVCVPLLPQNTTTTDDANSSSPEHASISGCDILPRHLMWT